MAYRVEVVPSAQKALKSIPVKDQLRIIDRITKLADDPHPPQAERLAAGDNLWRIRSGNYRVVYSIFVDVLVVTVVRIAHRREVYRDLP